MVKTHPQGGDKWKMFFFDGGLKSALAACRSFVANDAAEDLVLSCRAEAWRGEKS